MKTTSSCLVVINVLYIQYFSPPLIYGVHVLGLPGGCLKPQIVI